MRRWTVGDVRITQVVEMQNASPASFLFGDALTPERLGRYGWLRPRHVDGRWVATFPNARYLFGRTEWEHWTRHAENDGTIDQGQVMADSVTPIFEAGLAQLVEVDHAVTDEVSLESTPGHTHGHVSVRIVSGGEVAVITGDLMHPRSSAASPTWGRASTGRRPRCAGWARRWTWRGRCCCSRATRPTSSPATAWWPTAG
jgi:hypothetical protein